ncbi:hypothetical protein K3495_g588 [Podosphaera aphanis]|nr:hypothetical protein K3495_g588 [Podosphaera aphanis]
MLLTPSGLITRAFREQETIIDLTFGSPTVINKLIRCSTISQLDHGSDHLPIETSIDITVEKCEPARTRIWKAADCLAAKAEATSRIPSAPIFSTTIELDAYCDEVCRIVQDIARTTVPLHKHSGHVVPWRSDQVRDAVKRAGACRYKAMRSKYPEDFYAAKNAARSRDKVVREAKTASFRQKFQEKVQAFKQKFYPHTTADLEDISDKERLFQCANFDPIEAPAQLSTSLAITSEEDKLALNSKKAFSAPGWDEIPYHFLRALGNSFAHSLQAIAQGFWNLGHFPDRFKRARTIFVRKSGKGSYEEPGSCRPIALLPTMGKIIESITARRLADLAETHNLLPASQIGNRPSRSTDTALDLLTSQI